MYKNQVWNLVNPPKAKGLNECKWIYKLTRMKMFTSIKLDLLQKVFSQVQGVDYDEIVLL
jgi:hypothetical protein